MRRSSTIMLIAAVVLGLVAVFFARIFLIPSGAPQVAGAAPPTLTQVVVAAKPLVLGDPINAEALKLAEWPAGSLPPNAFKNAEEAIADKSRVALRAIAANELITASAISGQTTRLSASGLIGRSMRAVAVPLTEVSGTGGFLVPGDRVDVYVTHGERQDMRPYTDLLVQNARVLAVGQDTNYSKDKPEVTKTATIVVTPAQAQKVALAQAVGTLSLSLRGVVDDDPTKLGTTHIADLNDGLPKRAVVRKVRAPVRRAAPPKPPEVAIVRGTESTSYPVRGL